MKVSLGVVAASAFRLFVLPHAATTLDVLLMVIPFMFVGALLRASRITSLPAVDYNMCFLLAGQPFLPAETSASIILQGGAALILGCGGVALGHVFVPVDADKRVRRISGLIARDLARMADMASSTRLGPHWPTLMSQRLIRLSIHLSRIDNLQVNKPEIVLAALNLGHAVMALRKQLQNPALSEPEREQLQEIIAGFLAIFSSPQQIAASLEHTGEAHLRMESKLLQPESLLTLKKASTALKSFAQLFDAKPSAK